MTNQIKKILLYLFTLILTSNCVEHKIAIIVEPGGSFNYTHYSTGDKNDILDFDFPLTKNKNWNIESNLEEETDNYYYKFERLFDSNSDFPKSFYKEDSINSDALLKHDIKVDYSSTFIYEYYNLNVIFQGRNATSKYPLLRNFIIDQENPPLNWVHDGLSYIFNQALLEIDFGFNIENIIKHAIAEWLEKIKQDYNNDNLKENFDLVKNEGINIVKSNLINGSIDSFIQSINKFEQEARITIDLSDDIFEFLTVIPGYLQETNADSIFNDTLLWRFSGIDIVDHNYEIFAKTSIYHKSRFHWVIISIMLILTIVILYIIVRKVPDPSNFSK